MRRASLVLSLLVFGPCGRGEEPELRPRPTEQRAAATTKAEAPPSPPAASYVGSDVCVRCHANEAERWRESDHDLAMQVASPDLALGSFNGAVVELAGESLRFIRDDDGALVVESTPSSGEARRYPVAYLFGVEPLQQLLVELGGGRLQALTAAWDARSDEQGGQRWFALQASAQPGDALHWMGPGYNWNGQCAECHSTAVERGYDFEGDHFDTNYAEIDVGCEACHGPGSDHVQWAKTDASGLDHGLAHPLTKPDTRRWTMLDGAATARLSTTPDRSELDSCASCHSRRADLGPGKGEGYHDRYRLALLQDPLYFSDGQIRDEVFVLGSFMQSKMHAAGVVCSDCHDPHSLELRTTTPSETCVGCHRPEVFASENHHFHPPKSEGAQCESCHMPERVYMGVDARRDHRFSVPRPALSARVGSPDPCLGCHADRDAAWAEAEIEARAGEREPRWEFATALWLARAGQIEAAKPLAAIVADAERPVIVRATALVELARFPSPAFARLVRAEAKSEELLMRRAAATAMAALPPSEIDGAARGLLRDPVRSVRLEAAAALLGADTRGWAASEREAYGAALGEYRAAKFHTADRVESLVDLAALDLLDQRPDQARARLVRAIELDASFTPAHLNLADLERGLGREVEAEARLRAALGDAAEPGAVYHALGLALVRQRRLDEALLELKRAYELVPDQSRMGYVYAVALFDAGHREQALNILAAVHRRHPSDAPILAALADFSRKLGREEDARRYRAKLAQLTR